MDFFDRQDTARRNTKVLVVYFALAVALIVAAIYLGIAVVTGRGPWDAELFLLVAGGTVAVIFFGSLFKIIELAKGGGAVAQMLGGQPLNADSRDPDEQKLMNVVEEMAIASGTPVPEVYVLPEEEGINAFAAGNSTNDAAIGVTRGCMRLLSRDELQGVIAHEFSHILNGDMRLNLRLIGIVNGILCLAILGRILLRTRGKRNPLPPVGLVLLVIGSIGVFFGRLIKSAVSRQREFLADAAAVQFTRNPGGLAGALKKIGGLSQGSRLTAPNAEEASHLFFGNGLKPAWFNLMATHPPLEERIRALDPSFDGNFPPVEMPVANTRAAPPLLQRRGPPLIPMPQRSDFVSASVAGIAATATTIRTEQLLPHVGAPTVQHLRYAANLRDVLPESLATAAHEPFSASALIYALLLSADATTRASQLEQLQRRVEPGIFQETQRLLAHAATVPIPVRLPLVTMALPALRRLSRRQFETFSAAMTCIIESDREVDLFEYALQRIVRRHLEPAFQPAKRTVIQFYSMQALAQECAVLLSALARIGHVEPARIEDAFRLGVSQLRCPGVEFALLPDADCGLPQIDAALARLAQAVPQIKRNLLHAAAHTVAADGTIQSSEAELLRAFADTLDCPIPPFIEGV